jgi:hypothetical protein
MAGVIGAALAIAAISALSVALVKRNHRKESGSRGSY